MVALLLSLLELRRQAGEREGAERKAEIAERDVVVARKEEQVDDDAPQPCRDDVRAEPRLGRDTAATSSMTPTASMKV